ncbi:MAG: YkvA family protein [Candidatus Binatia bacterium]
MDELARTPTLVRGYSADRFFTKLGRFARVAGRIVVERALRLYYAAQDSGTPEWAKRVIYAGLAYFILPFDLIPDFVPAVGYTDDLGTLVLTLLAVSAYVSPEIKARARAKIRDWFGEP